MRNPPKAYVILKVAEPFDVLDAALQEHLGSCNGTGESHRQELTSGSVKFDLPPDAALGSIVLRKSKDPPSLMFLKEIDAGLWDLPKRNDADPPDQRLRAQAKKLDSLLSRQAHVITCLFRRLDADPACSGETNRLELRRALDELKARSTPPWLRQLADESPRSGPFAAAHLRHEAASLAEWNEPFIVHTTRASATAEPIESEKSEAEAPAYAFYKRGEMWTIAYGSKEFHLKDCKGLRYIHTMLRHPHRDFKPIELEVASEGTPVAAPIGPDEREMLNGTTDGGNDQPQIDEQTRRDVEAAISSLRTEKLAAEQRRDHVAAGGYEDQIEELEQYLAGSTALGGRTRTFVDEPERARQRVRKCIKRAFDKIADQSSDLAEYLGEHIETGYNCVYRVTPRNEIPWVLKNND